MPDGALCAVKAFRNDGETIGAFNERFFQAAARCTSKGHRVCIVMGCDDRLLTLSDLEIIEAIRSCTQMVRVLEDIAMVGVFSYARRGEMNGQPTGGGLIHPKAWDWCVNSYTASDQPIDWATYRLPEDPEPEPEDPVMPYVNLKTPLIELWEAEEKPHQDHPHVALLIKGKWLSINDQGGVEWRDANTTPGAQEGFIKSIKGYVAYRGKHSYGIVTV
jgi:hypothetical protein